MAGQETPNFSTKMGICELWDCRRTGYVVWLGYCWVCGNCVDKAVQAIQRGILKERLASSWKKLCGRGIENH